MTNFKNYTNRFFFIHGQTKDEFYTSDLRVANLEEILHRHLQKNGFERIAYYQGTKGLYCYDEKSFKLSFEKKSVQEKKENPLQAKNKVLGGILGQRISRKSTPKEEEFDASASNKLSKKMSDVDIVPHFDYILSENEIKTAIIFSDYNDFILHTEHSVVRNLSAKISDWDGLSSQNKNIIIFIIPSGISLQKIRENTNNYDQWQTLTSKMFSESNPESVKITQQMINISNPYKDEIRNLVNYMRIHNGMQIDWLNFDENIDELAKIAKERNIFLKNLSATLQNIGTFSKKEISKQFKINEDKRKGLEKLNHLVGLEYLTHEIKKLVKYANSKKKVVQEVHTDEVRRILLPLKKDKNEVNLHIALSGNPGTGKTTVSKIISEVFKENNILEVGHIIEAKSSDLIGEYVGHTAVKTQEKIDQAIGGVLFIDEAYKLLSNDFGQEAIDTLVEAMTAREGEFSVIIAGYPKEIEEFLNSNPGLKRRFANKIHLTDYEPEALVKIFERKMKKDGYSFSKELEDIFPHFIRNWFDDRDEKTFGNAGDALNLFESMSKSALDNNRDELCFKDVPQGLKNHLKKQSNDVMADALAKLDDIVGLESVKENIKRIIATIKMSKLRDENSKVVAGHYIFKGNPGTGKTTVARICGEILKELKVLKKGHFIETTREDLVKGYVGQTATQTKEVLESSLGGVLFIDEAYSLSKGGENDFGKEAIDTIVPFMENNMDNFTLIVAGYNEDMDKFIDANTGLKSRFTNTIVFQDYSNEEMLKIFKTFVTKENYKLSAGIEEKLITIFQRIRKNSDHFGNGRDARKVFNTIKTNLNMRLNSLNDLVQGDKRLYIIELEDLDNC